MWCTGVARLSKFQWHEYKWLIKNKLWFNFIFASAQPAYSLCGAMLVVHINFPWMKCNVEGDKKKRIWNKKFLLQIGRQKLSLLISQSLNIKEESEIILVKSIDRNTKQSVLKKAGWIFQMQFHLMTLLHWNETINVKVWHLSRCNVNVKFKTKNTTYDFWKCNVRFLKI